MIGQYWSHYWHWAGSNIGALPAELVLTAMLTALFGVAFRGPITRAVAWFRRERDELTDAALREAREDARKSRAIAADLYLHLTGTEHHHAPPREQE